MMCVCVCVYLCVCSYTAIHTTQSLRDNQPLVAMPALGVGRRAAASGLTTATAEDTSQSQSLLLPPSPGSPPMVIQLQTDDDDVPPPGAHDLLPLTAVGLRSLQWHFQRQDRRRSTPGHNSTNNTSSSLSASSGVASTPSPATLDPSLHPRPIPFQEQRISDWVQETLTHAVDLRQKQRQVEEHLLHQHDFLL